MEEILAVRVEGEIVGNCMVDYRGVDLDGDRGPAVYNVCGFVFGKATFGGV